MIERQDPYAPLALQELAVGAASRDKRDEGECVLPVPDGAPPMPTTHSKWGGAPSGRWPYFDASGALLFEVWRFDPPNERKQFPCVSLWRASGGRLEWRWKGVPEPRALYNLDKLSARPDASVVICEGEKAADAAAKVFPNSVVITSPGGSHAASKADWKPLGGRKVLIWPDADEPGSKYAAEVAATLRGLRCEVSIINAMTLASVAPNDCQREPVEGWDAADAIAEWQDLSALRKAAAGLAKPFKAATDAANDRPPPCDDIDAEIARLAKLKIVEYEQVSEEEAKRLGLRKPVLDKLVANERPCDTAPGQGRPLELPEPEPWPEPVDGAELASGLIRAVRRYVIMPEHDALTVALWVLHAYCFDPFHCTPRLAITAPEKRCGKTTLLDVISQLVPRPLSTANISAAATFRTIEACRPTLMVDEADTFLGDNEELRGILNSGHRNGGQVIRTVGDDFEPRAFSTHSPLAIAQIGKLPETLADRSLPVAMRRRMPGEAVASFRLGRTGDLTEMARKAVRWVADHAKEIRQCDPVIPEGIFNRAADNWFPVLAVAEIMGGEWPALAQNSALAACKVVEQESRAIMLLGDIRDAFAAGKVDRMWSKAIVTRLVSLEERPWAEANHGKLLTTNGLAKMLDRFEVKSKKLRVGTDTAQGYVLEDFQDTFRRYLNIGVSSGTYTFPPDNGFQNGTPAHSNGIKGLGAKQNGTQSPGVPFQKLRNHLISSGCSGVPFQKGDNPEERYVTIESGDWEGEI